MTSDTALRDIVRLDESGLGIYVWPDRPDWCVPTSRGDFVFRRMIDGTRESGVAEAYAQQFGDIHNLAGARGRGDIAK